jgi:hypothetical protein
MNGLPVCRGLILCEQLIVEEGSKNVTLVNCFSGRIVDDFPSPPQRLVVYAVLAGGRGTIPVTLRVVRLSDGEIILNQAQPCRFADPLGEVRFVYRLTTLIYSDPSWYEFALVSGSEVLAQTRIRVRLRGTSP